MYRVMIVHGNDDEVDTYFTNYESAVEWAEDYEAERHGEKHYLQRLGSKYYDEVPDMFTQWGANSHYVLIRNIEGEPRQVKPEPPQSEALSDLLEFANALTEIREMFAAMVAGFVEDGFTDREARAVITGVFANNQDKKG